MNGSFFLLFLFASLLFTFLFVGQLLFRSALKNVLQASLFDQLCNPLVCVLVERVYVVSERAREQGRVLRNHCDLVSQRFQIQLADVLSVDLDRATFQLDDPGQGHAQSGLACARAAHHTDFLPSFSLEAYALESQVAVWAVSEVRVLELNNAVTGPVLARLIRSLDLLLRHVEKVEDALSTLAAAFEPVDAANHLAYDAHVLSRVEQEDERDCVRRGAVLGDKVEREGKDAFAEHHHS